MKVYSYLRFSSSKQELGDSIRRQTKLAEDYCEKHNLVLDREFNLTDHGISAFRGKNLAGGNLGIFLEAIKLGKVPIGSLLLVENLDRLSRDEVTTALSVFISIINSGVSIVTLGDNKRFDKSNINDLGNLLFSIVEMARANSESVIKSQRLNAVWDIKTKKAKDGNFIITSRCPAWLKVKNHKFEVIQERADIINQIFNMSLNGMGQRMITNILNQNKIPSWSQKGWHSSTIKRILEEPKVIGTHIPKKHVGGKPISQDPILNYFPKIIDDDLFYKVQDLIKTRTKQQGRISQVINPLAGLLKCSICGNTLVMINPGNDKQPRLQCTEFRRGKSPECKGSLLFRSVCLAVSNIITNIDITELHRNDEEQHGSIQHQLQELSNQRIKTIESIDLYTQALSHGNAKVIIKKLEDAEKLVDDINAQISELESRSKVTELRSDILKDIGVLLSQDLSKESSLILKGMIRKVLKQVTVDVIQGDISIHLII
jgi:DNA invertase Pin-like site-specific DNA recombinase